MTTNVWEHIDVAGTQMHYGLQCGPEIYTVPTSQKPSTEMDADPTSQVQCSMFGWACCISGEVLKYHRWLSYEAVRTQIHHGVGKKFRTPIHHGLQHIPKIDGDPISQKPSLEIDAYPTSQLHSLQGKVPILVH